MILGGAEFAPVLLVALVWMSKHKLPLCKGGWLCSEPQGKAVGLGWPGHCSPRRGMGRGLHFSHTLDAIHPFGWSVLTCSLSSSFRPSRFSRGFGAPSVSSRLLLLFACPCPQAQTRRVRVLIYYPFINTPLSTMCMHRSCLCMLACTPLRPFLVTFSDMSPKESTQLLWLGSASASPV